MRSTCIRLVALLLAAGLCPAGQGFAQEKADAKTTRFAETAMMVLQGCGIQLMEYRRFAYFQSWSRLQGGDFDVEQQKRFKSFPDDLMKALGNQENVDHEAAVAFLGGYGGVVR